MTLGAYIGVTGVVHPVDAATVYDLRGETPSGYVLMAGVLVSGKTLRGQAVTNRRYPVLREAAQRVRDLRDEWIAPVVHYNLGDDERPLDTQILNVIEATDPEGVQFNVGRPDVEAVRRCWLGGSQMAWILQVNARSLLGITPEAVWAYVSKYAGMATHALVDLSQGTGQGLGLAWTTAVLAGWRPEWPRPGVAGGLGPDSGEVARACLRALPPGLELSFDAESRLRVPVRDPFPGMPCQDRLDAALARTYVETITAAIHTVRRERKTP